MSDSPALRDVDGTALDGLTLDAVTDSAPLPYEPAESDVEPSLVHRVHAARSRNKSVMTLILAGKLGVPERQVVAALPRELVTPLDVSQYEAMFRKLSAVEPVHAICSNAACTMESTGKLGGFSHAGPFFNVQTSTLDLHLRPAELTHAYAVEKPGHMDGVSTLSVQFFDKAGHSAIKLFLSFGGKVAAPETRAVWEAVREAFAKKVEGRR